MDVYGFSRADCLIKTAGAKVVVIIWIRIDAAQIGGVADPSNRNTLRGKVISTEEKLKIPTGINVPPTGMFHAELSDFLRELRGGEHGLSPTEAEIVRACGILEGALGGN